MWLWKFMQKKKIFRNVILLWKRLKHSMRWDEEHYGLPYDLDNYMIVATSAFNMGAMENKGLKYFQYVMCIGR